MFTHVRAWKVVLRLIDDASFIKTYQTDHKVILSLNRFHSRSNTTQTRGRPNVDFTDTGITNLGSAYREVLKIDTE